MSDLNPKIEATIANIACGANIPCGDMQGNLAYPYVVGTKSRQVTGFERAIGARIRDARERLGVNLTELGLAYGGHRQTVQHWEHGKNFPPLKDFPRLCHLLRMDANALLGMTAMKALTEQDILSARMQIQAIARASKEQGTVRHRATVRLRRSSTHAG
jgi:transcriptional regulator with XRE-family HTH domain